MCVCQTDLKQGWSPENSKVCNLGWRLYTSSDTAKSYYHRLQSMYVYGCGVNVVGEHRGSHHLETSDVKVTDAHKVKLGGRAHGNTPEVAARVGVRREGEGGERHQPDYEQHMAPAGGKQLRSGG